MWRAAGALISCCSTTLGGASSPDKISNNLNNINDLKFYHDIRGKLGFSRFCFYYAENFGILSFSGVAQSLVN